MDWPAALTAFEAYLAVERAYSPRTVEKWRSGRKAPRERYRSDILCAVERAAMRMSRLNTESRDAKRSL